MPDQLARLRWTILPDEEVKRRKDDAFGVHTAYAELLMQVAKDCPTPFAVGLYSGWGTGKTSIIRLLQELVSSETHPTLSVVYLDVWKYSSDPLKRWILLETQRQLEEQKLLIEYEFDNRTLKSHLEFEEELEDKDRIEINFKNFFGLLLSCAFLVALSAVAVIYLPPSWKFRSALTWILTLSAGSGVVALIVGAAMKKIGESFSGMMFRRTIKHVTAKPAFSSEKFSQIFRDIVSKVSAANSNRRLVFVFDNLDRCPADVAVDVIGVVKTFLEEPGCVYVIPCDEQAILAHVKRSFLQSEDHGSDRYANQFLTKFFQMTLRLPPAADLAVEDYLDKELGEAGMGDLTTDARDVLVLGYRGETPRQVKRVLNDLIGYRGIAERVEADGLVEKGALTGDLGHLTKMAVLSVKWPSFMRELAEDPEIWVDVMEKVRTQTNDAGNESSSDLDQFLWNTRLVSPEADIRPWLYLRRGALEKDAVLNRRIEEILQNGSAQPLLDLLNSAESNKAQILQIVSSISRRWLNAKRRVLLRNGGPVLLKVSLAMPDDNELRRDAVDVVEYLATPAGPEEMEELFDIKDVLALVLSLPQWQKSKLLKSYLELFETRFPMIVGRRAIFLQLIEHGSILTSTQKSTLAGLLNSRYSVPNGEKEVLDIFGFVADDLVNRSWIVSEGLLARVANGVLFDGSDLDQKRIDSVIALRTKLDEPSREILWGKTEKQLDPARTPKVDEASHAAIRFLQSFEPDMFSAEGAESIERALVGQLSRTPPALKAPWLDPILHLYSRLGESYAPSVDEHVRIALVQSDPTAAATVLGALSAGSHRALLERPSLRAILKEQAKNYEGRFKASARVSRAENLSTFKPEDLLDHPDLFDDSLSWDLALFIAAAARALDNKELGAENVMSRVVDFCDKYIPASLVTQSELYEATVKFGQDYPSVMKGRLAELLTLCAQIYVVADRVTEYSNFSFAKSKLSVDERTEATKEVLKHLAARGPGWIELLLLVIGDVSQDADVARNGEIVGNLADLAFWAAKERPTEIISALPLAVRFLDANRQEDYVDRALDVLLGLSVEGEDLAKMEPFMELVSSLPERVKDRIAEKTGRFAYRMLGAAKSDQTKLRALKLVTAVHSADVTASILEQLQPLSESSSSELSTAAKSLLDSGLSPRQ